MYDEVRKEHLIRALSFMEHFEGISLTQVEETLLRESKEKRKTLSKEAVIAKGYDIYKKRSVPAYQVTQTLRDSGFIKPISTSFENERYHLTEEGQTYLERSFTHNFSSAFMAFNEELNTLMTQLGMPKLHPMQIMRFYYYKVPIEAIVKDYGTWSTTANKVADYQKELFKQLGYSIEEIEHSPIFLLTPKLFLPKRFINADVELEIEGLDSQVSIHLSRPYPNKRYVVAENRCGLIKNSIGFFSILNPLDSSNNRKKIVLKWTINKEIHIIHHMDISFSLIKNGGRLYSTNQVMIQKNAQAEFTSTTWFPTDISYYRNRDVRMETRGKDIQINERIELESFHLENNNEVLRNKHFQTYLDTCPAK